MALGDFLGVVVRCISRESFSSKKGIVL